MHVHYVSYHYYRIKIEKKEEVDYSAADTHVSARHVFTWYTMDFLPVSFSPNIIILCTT